MSPDTGARRIDLDWIRIVAFLLLILYHVGMYYVSWDWHVKSPAASSTIEPLMFLTNPWRLALLFLVSGVATAYMLGKLAPGPLARSRSWRLLVPLVFGIVVIVPPQSYWEVVEKGGYSLDYLEFWGRYLRADQTFCRGKDCLIVPTWNHLWFVIYLWFYTMVIAGIVSLAPSWRERWEMRLEGALTGWKLIVVPWLLLAIVRMALVGRFGSTHAFVDDWYNHAQYFLVFSIGFLAARSDSIWAGMERLRWIALLLAFATWGLLVWYFQLRSGPAVPDSGLRMAQRVVYGLNEWVWIVAICGFARRWIKRDSPARRYLTDAIFPFYIVHQTAIILFAIWLRPLAIPPLAEGLLLIALTAVVCVATYEIVKRVRWLRPLFGLRQRRATSAASGGIATPG
ncbi:acyltransferase family protein [Usitatibacter palustris]|uniref:Glucans biosynthesis protein C n=1 Tax=Usitatibacter palustris TaxID=2732487 RepID=A0A6M4H2M7_9PROT|nr:acyltransferase family protein [Usitatibacter palustris]QJR13766.1 Glucans biosynthesis protein C [Usitatibacter palustris]